MTDTEFNAVKAFLSAYRYTELDLRVRRAELTRLTARKEALILEGNTDLLFHLEHAICAAKDAIRVLCTRQAEIEAAIDTVESAALREILTQHYICALDLKEIAERMHYSDRHMRRLHRKAFRFPPFRPLKSGDPPRAHFPLSKEFETAAAKSWGLFSFPEFRHLLRTADAARFAVPHRGENGDFEKEFIWNL